MSVKKILPVKIIFTKKSKRILYTKYGKGLCFIALPVTEHTAPLTSIYTNIFYHQILKLALFY